MKACIHVFTASANPRRGGLEASCLRISMQLAGLSRCQVTIYSRNTSSTDAVEIDSGDVRIEHLRADREALAEPLVLSGGNVDSERYRIDGMLLRNGIRRSMAEYPDFRHLILSFYASSAGFVAQHVASELAIPHIATVRGSDFNADYKNPYRHGSFDFTVRNATWVVTTNSAQQEAIAKLVGRRDKVRVIPNGLEVADALPIWTPPVHRSGSLRIVSDCGFTYKKATHVLIRTVMGLREQGIPISLTVFGDDEDGGSTYWGKLRDAAIVAHPDTFRFAPHASRNEIVEALMVSDIYCSTSLGEGCSNAWLVPMCMGIPALLTQTGSIADLGEGLPQIRAVLPGDLVGFREALLEMIELATSGQLPSQDLEATQRLRDQLDVRRERARWETVIAGILPKHDTVEVKEQRRVLFFVHDGTGLGHLQRVSRIARAIQGPCASLVVCGHRQGSWIVPPECEYVHLPSLDSLLPNKARYWGRQPFLEVDRAGALRLRSGMLQGVFQAFDPDAVFVDYLPLGKFDELADVLWTSRAKKYFVLRGVLDHPDNVRLDILGGRSFDALETLYDRILVACDRRICDVVGEYGLPPNIAQKVKYVGYISDPVEKSTIDMVRAERGVHAGERWVVCSAGGGALGEKVISECRRCVHDLDNVVMDIVMGPRSASDWPHRINEYVSSGRMRLHRESKQLALMHGSADIVVCAGGYNSLVESLEGTASIITVPVQLRTNDEQFIHSDRLRAFTEIQVVTRLHELETAIRSEVSKERRTDAVSRRTQIDMNGIVRTRGLLFEDLGL